MLTLTSEEVLFDRHVRRILGIDFFPGTPAEAIEIIGRGGLLVAPSAPGLVHLRTSPRYREALQEADVCLSDSGLMVVIWSLLTGERIPRISGLALMRRLLEVEDVRRSGNTFWIMSSPKSSDRNLKWLRGKGIVVPPQNVYLAPGYGSLVEDALLVDVLRGVRPKHIIVTVGGGKQEPLGLYLMQHLDYRPAIYCTGAAIAFLSGDQVKIPVWADRCYLGACLRCARNPSTNVRRYWRARKLLTMMIEYRSELPPLNA